MNMQQSIIDLQEILAASGLTLCAGQAVTELPASIWLEQPIKRTGTLLLIGHGGRSFWDAFHKNRPQCSDPVDAFSARISAQALDQAFPEVKRQQLFPDPGCPVNLMALGQALGVHTPSPLGMGIHAEYGLWSAYRALWWLDTAWPADISAKVDSTTDICARCRTQECINSCPAEALSHHNMPNLSLCVQHRLAEDSTCTSTCLARMACPVSAEHRYTPAQMAYHYDLERSQIRHFIKHG